MAKFSNAGRAGGGSTALDRLAAKAQVQLPVEPQEDVTTSPAAFKGTAFDTSVNLSAVEELPSAPQPMNPQEQLEATLQEQQRQAVPDMRQRMANPMPEFKIQSVGTTGVDGGIFDRANKMAAAVEAGNLIPPVDLRNTTSDGSSFQAAIAGADGPTIAETIGAEKEGSVQAGINRVGAVDYTNPRSPKVDPDFVKAASLVTENMLMSIAGGAEQQIEGEADPIAAAQGQEAYDPGNMKIRQIAKQQSNGAIGQQIATEYQRLKGVEVPQRIPAKEAETVGDAFKMMWVSQNPELARVVRDPVSNQKFIELKPAGESALQNGDADRKKLFPSRYVKPAKNPLPRGKLPGDTGENVVKNVQGQIGKQKFGKTLEDAMVNLGKVPNVVDSQRLRILYSTALPVLKGGNFDTVSARINNVGADKRAKYVAKSGEAEAEIEMQKAANKLAQEIQAIATERKGANYLSYAIQGFQGRISPQQSKFNPTTSKAVRFVTRNAVPSPAKPGSRVDYNLRQMYAMMLVPGADEVLPHVREQKFDAYQATIEAYGDKLEAALQMSEQEAEAISQAIEQGVPLTDPNFPKIKPLALDPQTDGDLIAKIAAKGEDGMHYIDGLIDAAKYVKARRAGNTYHSYFNAYIDGKTNGIASNGIQMGISATARQTGVIRASKDDYLDEPGDVRAVLKNELMYALDNGGFTGVEEIHGDLVTLARAIFSHRDLNKKTTMTFGYGKEVPTFSAEMEATADLLVTDPSLIKDEELRAAYEGAYKVVKDYFPEQYALGETLMTIYGPALESVMSPEALASRGVMRSVALLYAATNQLMTMMGPTGMDMHFGRAVQDDSQTTTTSYNVKGTDIDKGSKEFTAVHQGTELTAAAPRMYEDQPAYGDYAYGGSVVGPVQALDAAAVGLTASGKSWNRLRAASGGNAYMHTIYDAFKADAMGFDVILEEVNTNWLDASMNWSYLEEAQKSIREDMAKWKAEQRKRDPRSTVTANEAMFMKYILKPVTSAKGNEWPANFVKRVGSAGELNKRYGKDDAAMKMGWDLIGKMRKVGYDWKNPPANITVAQLNTFVEHIENVLQTNQRLSSMIKQTNANKAELKKEILRDGYKTKSGRVIPLQYYAH